MFSFIFSFHFPLTTVAYHTTMNLNPTAFSLTEIFLGNRSIIGSLQLRLSSRPSVCRQDDLSTPRKESISVRVLFVDVDTLRPDHLGCYGYQRDTSPCVDSIAKEGIIFDNYYTTNAPCLPSRAALVTGRYGIHTGVVGHGGTAADMRLGGPNRGFSDEVGIHNLFNLFRKAGIRTASVSTFAERHAAWWFNAGFDETCNVGGCGMETADKVTPAALDWLSRHADQDNWCLHVHYWDPHTPYRAPASFGEPFANEPLCDPWITEEIFDQHYHHVGPHSAQEVNMWNDRANPAFPRHLARLENLKDVKYFMDQYDCGVRYTDDNIKKMVDFLKEKGLYEDMVIIVTSDHGENLGELGLYGEHGTADNPTCRIPMIIKWPGGKQGIRDSALHANLDLAPTIEQLLGQTSNARWDGKSYADTILEGVEDGHQDIVINQCAHVCQRSVRFDHYIYIRTVHDGYHLFDDEMLFDLEKDPHEIHNLASELPDVCAKGAKMILDWEYQMMKTSDSDADPMWTVFREGGPYHAQEGDIDAYIERLRDTDRAEGAEKLIARIKSGYYNP